ncbi:MAG: GTPase Era [Acidobacteriaceae bacterium]|nr:GTPase Era [Acidobacteriaceae bacterium]
MSAHHVGFVSIAGRPNAGKSTLLNALVGEPIAITAYQAQTTRTAIQGVLNTPDAQIIFIDTPGIHKSDTLLNRRMMETVRSALLDRDLILFVVDATRTPTEEDEHALSAVNKSAKAFLVLNKVDRVEDKPLLLPLIEYYVARFPFLNSIPISARTGEGLDNLKRLITEALPEGEPLFPSDYLTDQPLRFMAAEIIREQILRVTREEVPHSTAILIDKWEETEGLTKIAATIHVERPGQKIILIGKGGQVLKQIGTGARHRLERLLERRVFLSLFVKVKPNWREDPSFLNVIDWRAMLGSEREE